VGKSLSLAVKAKAPGLPLLYLFNFVPPFALFVIARSPDRSGRRGNHWDGSD
jgi:hypothetical protein